MEKYSVSGLQMLADSGGPPVFPRPPETTSLGPQSLGPLLGDLMYRLGAWTLLAASGVINTQAPVLSYPSRLQCVLTAEVHNVMCAAKVTRGGAKAELVDM